MNLSELDVFLSYCSKDASHVNRIDEFFRDEGILLTRDVRDIEFKASVRKFMKRVESADYVIAVVSDSYLRSVNCMYEMSVLIKSGEFDAKFLPIILPDADLYSDDGMKRYLSHWLEKKSDFHNMFLKEMLPPIPGLWEKWRVINDICGFDLRFHRVRACNQAR